MVKLFCTPSSERSPALARSRQRRAQRGMAVFLVVLVLTMVSAIGVFSMHSASLVDRASGFNRQNVQAIAMVEFGARAAATWIDSNRYIVNTDIKAAGCEPDLQSANPDAVCVPLKDTMLTDLFTASAPTPFADGVMGLLNSPWDPATIRSEMVTELTEPFNANAAALPGSGGSIKELTVTTKTRIFPTDLGSTSVCANGAKGAMSQQRIRAHVLVLQL
ncbi:MAG TPA: hypothetical protein VFS67_13480 [Polyangiaceae bacterium]|jgi:hypothetical protein|nr:hypothetical protein [Polyangiaceae bacterium]